MGNSVIRVLHVDDNPRERSHFAGLGSRLGWEVASASDGVLALLETAERQFDLIVSDVAMPKLDGPDMISILRSSDSVNRRTPVILVSCRVDESVQTRAQELGIEAVLSKPLLLGPVRFESERVLAGCAATQHGEAQSGSFYPAL